MVSVPLTVISPATISVRWTVAVTVSKSSSPPSSMVIPATVAVASSRLKVTVCVLRILAVWVAEGTLPLIHVPPVFQLPVAAEATSAVVKSIVGAVSFGKASLPAAS